MVTSVLMNVSNFIMDFSCICTKPPPQTFWNKMRKHWYVAFKVTYINDINIGLSVEAHEEEPHKKFVIYMCMCAKYVQIWDIDSANIQTVQ